jgi:putative intracellular protease/amidase
MSSRAFSTLVALDVRFHLFPVTPDLADGLIAMFDLVDDAASIQLIREFYDASLLITALCHGAAALLNVTLADGSYLIEGERVTGFSNQEEIDVDRVKDMPFRLEDALAKNSGGHYEKSAKAWESHVIVSSTKKLLWGQNPGSAKPLAVELLKLLDVSV